MRVFDIPLSDKTGEHEPYMTAYLQEPMPQDPEKKLPAVVVYPGGGYTHLAAHEGEPVAMAVLQPGSVRALSGAAARWRACAFRHPRACGGVERRSGENRDPWLLGGRTRGRDTGLSVGQPGGAGSRNRSL